MTGSGFDIGDLLSVTGVTGLVLLFCAYFLALEAIFLSFARQTAARSQLKKRLATASSAQEQLQALAKMRQKRSLSPDGQYILPLVWVNRLIVQSGVTWGVAGFPAAFTGTSAAVFLPVLLIGGNVPIALAAGLLGGAGLLFLFLRTMRDRRRSKLEGQLPEAIDILVRSLRAGHPVPSAIRLVARELPDPIGTEFAIVGDELTYGLDLETAMSNMGSRVGQPDLALVVISTGIQASTGGNLAEILSSMSKVVRERLKLRLKVKAMSAEGRVSAIILSVLPFALFALLALVAPSFYGEIWNEPVVKIILAASVAWLMVGNIIMFRMVKFEI